MFKDLKILFNTIAYLMIALFLIVFFIKGTWLNPAILALASVAGGVASIFEVKEKGEKLTTVRIIMVLISVIATVVVHLAYIGVL